MCDSDTENDDTVMSTRSQRTAAATAAARLDDIIDDDSDFEVSSKQRVSTSAATRRDTAKYYTLTIMIFRKSVQSQMIANPLVQFKKI